MRLYRDMEKMVLRSDNQVNWPAKLEESGSKNPFAPILLRRRLRLFHSILGLQPGQPAAPDPDFLVYLIEGTGHLHQVRMAAGDQFKNLENFVRGSHSPSPSTWKLLIATLGVDDATLRAFAHGRKDGPLLPFYVAFFKSLETALLGSFRTSVHGKVHCPCCRADMLDDSTVWWAKQDLLVPPDAAHFLDRLMSAMLGAVMLSEGLGRLLGWSALSAAEAVELAKPVQHPMGNWMEKVRQHRRLEYDWQLTLNGKFGDSEPEADGRLRKWRSGQDLIPMAKAVAMIEPITDSSKLKHALSVARALSLAVDLVQATAGDARAPSRVAAQGIVYERLRQLHLHARIATAADARAAAAGNDGR